MYTKGFGNKHCTPQQKIIIVDIYHKHTSHLCHQLVDIFDQSYI